MIYKTMAQALDANHFIMAPGIQDMITAVVANKVGFDFVYASGYWSVASAYGLPDAGIATYTQILDRVKILTEVSNANVIADADTGYGGLLNVHHTIRGYEDAGVAGIQIEDQEFPKKCGHTPFTRAIPLSDMVDKLKVATDARQREDMMIIARTDALQSEGFESALERANAYAEAGADIIFVEALASQDEMRKACSAVSKPMLANMATGGKTPILTASELQALGFSVAIYPAMASLAAAAAAEKAMVALKATGHPEENAPTLFDFNEFCSLIGFDQVWEFEEKWGPKA